MSIQQALGKTSLPKYSQVFILDENNALVTVPKQASTEGSFSLEMAFLRYTKEGTFLVTKAFSIDRDTLQLFYDRSLKKAGIFIVEDVGGVSIYDYRNAQIRIIDNLFSKVYTSREMAYQDNDVDCNFADDQEQCDSYGKFVVGVISITVPLKSHCDDFESGEKEIRLFTKYYYEQKRGPMLIYRDVDALYEEKPSYDYSLGLVDYSLIALNSKAENPLYALVSGLQDHAELIATSHEYISKLIQRQIDNFDESGSIQTDISKYQAKLRLYK